MTPDEEAGFIRAVIAGLEDLEAEREVSFNEARARLLPMADHEGLNDPLADPP